MKTFLVPMSNELNYTIYNDKLFLKINCCNKMVGTFTLYSKHLDLKKKECINMMNKSLIFQIIKVYNI